MLCQFSKNPHHWHLITFFTPNSWYLNSLDYLQQYSCEIGLARISPYTWCFLLVIFYLLTLTLLLSCKSLVHTVFSIEPSSILKPITSDYSSSWIKPFFFLPLYLLNGFGVFFVFFFTNSATLRRVL